MSIIQILNVFSLCSFSFSFVLADLVEEEEDGKKKLSI